MHPGKPGIGSKAFVYTKLLHVASIGRDQTTVSHCAPYPVEQRSLRSIAYRDGSTFSAFGPRGLENKTVSVIREAWPKLDRFLPAKPEGPLQLQTHTDVIVCNFLQIWCVYRLRFRGVGHELTVWDAIVIVGSGYHILFIHFPRPPAQYRHSVLDRAAGEILRQPVRDQGIHMLRFQRSCVHPVESQHVQLIGDMHQMMGPLALGAVTAVPILAAELFELVVQVPQGAISVW